jgi:hypothetical protein
MKGGIGTASIKLSNGVIVGAIVAVNCIGNVIDPKTGTTKRRRRFSNSPNDFEARMMCGEGPYRIGHLAGNHGYAYRLSRLFDMDPSTLDSHAGRRGYVGYAPG